VGGCEANGAFDGALGIREEAGFEEAACGGCIAVGGLAHAFFLEGVGVGVVKGGVVGREFEGGPAGLEASSDVYKLRIQDAREVREALGLSSLVHADGDHRLVELGAGGGDDDGALEDALGLAFASDGDEFLVDVDDGGEEAILAVGLAENFDLEEADGLAGVFLELKFVDDEEGFPVAHLGCECGGELEEVVAAFLLVSGGGHFACGAAVDIHVDGGEFEQALTTGRCPFDHADGHVAHGRAEELVAGGVGLAERGEGLAETLDVREGLWGDGPYFLEELDGAIEVLVARGDGGGGEEHVDLFGECAEAAVDFGEGFGGEEVVGDALEEGFEVAAGGLVVAAGEGLAGECLHLALVEFDVAGVGAKLDGAPSCGVVLGVCLDDAFEGGEGFRIASGDGEHFGGLAECLDGLALLSHGLEDVRVAYRHGSVVAEDRECLDDVLGGGLVLAVAVGGEFGVEEAGACPGLVVGIAEALEAGELAEDFAVLGIEDGGLLLEEADAAFEFAGFLGHAGGVEEGFGGAAFVAGAVADGGEAFGQFEVFGIGEEGDGEMVGAEGEVVGLLSVGGGGEAGFADRGDGALGDGKGEPVGEFQGGGEFAAVAAGGVEGNEGLGSVDFALLDDALAILLDGIYLEGFEAITAMDGAVALEPGADDDDAFGMDAKSGENTARVERGVHGLDYVRICFAHRVSTADFLAAPTIVKS
jgi:hypothetical protein